MLDNWQPVASAQDVGPAGDHSMSCNRLAATAAGRCTNAVMVAAAVAAAVGEVEVGEVHERGHS